MQLIQLAAVCTYLNVREYYINCKSYYQIHIYLHLYPICFLETGNDICIGLYGSYFST